MCSQLHIFSDELQANAKETAIAELVNYKIKTKSSIEVYYIHKSEFVFIIQPPLESSFGSSRHVQGGIQANSVAIPELRAERNYASLPLHNEP